MAFHYYESIGKSSIVNGRDVKFPVKGALGSIYLEHCHQILWRLTFCGESPEGSCCVASRGSDRGGRARLVGGQESQSGAVE